MAGKFGSRANEFGATTGASCSSRIKVAAFFRISCHQRDSKLCVSQVAARISHWTWPTVAVIVRDRSWFEGQPTRLKEAAAAAATAALSSYASGRQSAEMALVYLIIRASQQTLMRYENANS